MAPKTSDIQLITTFGKHYRERLGEQYLPTWARDKKIFNELLEFFDGNVVRIEELINVYFSKDQRIYSVPFFRAQVNELVQLVPQDKPKPKKLRNPDEERFL